MIFSPSQPGQSGAPRFGGDFSVHGPKSQLDAVRRYIYNQTWYQDHFYYQELEVKGGLLPLASSGEKPDADASQEDSYEVVRFLTGIDALRRKFKPELEQLYVLFRMGQDKNLMPGEDDAQAAAELLAELRQKLPARLLKNLDLREVTTHRDALRNQDGMEIHPRTPLYAADEFLKQAETQEFDLESGTFKKPGGSRRIPITRS